MLHSQYHFAFICGQREVGQDAVDALNAVNGESFELLVAAELCE